MQPPPLSLNSLFAPQVQFVVPLFQRPYVWNRERNWDPLWQDLRRVADRVLLGTPARSHFLGQIVLQMLQTTTPMGVSRREVIDGQQRLTTLQVLLKAAIHALTEFEAGDVTGLLEPLTRNLVMPSAPPDFAFKVLPTNADRSAFRSVMSPSNNIIGVAGHPLHDAYSYFRAQMSNWLEGSAKTRYMRISALVDTLQNRLLLIPIDLDANDEAQVIFETLNGRGTPLLPSDLTKNWLLRQIERDSENPEIAYEAHWRPFDEQQSYWREEIGRGHSKRARLDIFLQHYLTARTCSEVAAAHLFTDFLDYMQRTKSPTASEVISDIDSAAQHYQSFTPNYPEPIPARFFGWLDALEIGTAAPFLIRLFELCASAPAARDFVLSDLESFLVRRMVCRYNTRSYGSLFVRLLDSIGDIAEDAPASVRAALLRGNTPVDRWPHDSEFSAALLLKPAYQKMRINALLRALELGLRSHYMPKMDVPSELWIEHIMPQEWRKNWPLDYQAAATGDEELPEDRRDRLVQTIGNLTLITAPLNMTLSNAGWSSKAPALREHSQLLVMNQKIVDQEFWDEEKIISRAKQLIKVAFKLWPRPVEHAVETG